MEDLLEFYNVDTSGLSFGREWYPVLCPFHDDRTESASVNLLDDRYVCHGCGVHGDILDVVSQVEGLTVREAFDWLEENLG